MAHLLGHVPVWKDTLSTAMLPKEFCPTTPSKITCDQKRSLRSEPMMVCGPTLKGAAGDETGT